IPLREALGRALNSKDAIARIDINIYGPLSQFSSVGKILSGHKVFLQRPDHQRRGTAYNNPHIVTFPGIHISSSNDVPQKLENLQASVPDTERFQKTIANVYASLKRRTNLHQVEGSHLLKTLLLPHQMEALDFMIQREAGPIPPEYRLWRPMTETMEGWFRHAITHQRVRTEWSETGGGILADEMGMGKSLSILALAVKTTRDAQSWATLSDLESQPTLKEQKRRSSATLIIVPSALLINSWVKEVKKHLCENVRFITYHGQRRDQVSLHFQDADIVITTYHTLVVDFKNKRSPIHHTEWYRLVLDEAHIIRRQSTTFNRAVSEVSAHSRWCLTGTPIQNRLDDIGALFSFIRVHPFDSIANFRRHISIPYEENGERRDIALQSFALLLDSTCLRRTRDLLQLPNRHDRLHVINFTDQERDQYNQTKKIMNRTLRQRVGDSFVKSRFGMFQIQLQLRIFCNHGTFQQSFAWARRSLRDEQEAAMCLFGNLGEVRCSACHQVVPIMDSNTIYRADQRSCAHTLCSECAEESRTDHPSESVNVIQCPLCIASGCPGSLVPGVQGEINGNHYFRTNGISSKMKAVTSDVKRGLWESKTIVFTSWTHTLDLVEKHFEKESIPFERIDGESPLPRRQKILDDFGRLNTTPVLIMTTGVGAFGLNLTSANRIFLVEPQWNPSVENQAIARAQRLGQDRSVIVTRYMVEDTIEQVS
ncbi:hypothetical protein NA57DRAFT_11514, partial [Rhizodiscina lignyota]